MCSLESQCTDWREGEVRSLTETTSPATSPQGMTGLHCVGDTGTPRADGSLERRNSSCVSSQGQPRPLKRTWFHTCIQSLVMESSYFSPKLFFRRNSFSLYVWQQDGWQLFQLRLGWVTLTYVREKTAFLARKTKCEGWHRCFQSPPLCLTSYHGTCGFGLDKDRGRRCLFLFEARDKW